MPAYSFKPQFVPFILAGEKTHTIRSPRRHAQRTDQLCHLYTGMRTRQCRKLFTAPCLKVERIVIGANGVVIVDGEQLAKDEREALARRDGFQSFSDMLAFWDGRLPFEGHIIHWDYTRREP